MPGIKRLRKRLNRSFAQALKTIEIFLCDFRWPVLHFNANQHRCRRSAL